MNKIAIIGGGAAGMMAGFKAREANADARITLFEKNPKLGAKVIISGGGRCNVTTGIQDIAEVLKKYPRGDKFLRHAIYSFPPKDVFEWFEEKGVPLKIEDDKRVFPKSNDGKDIVKVFEKYFAQNDVEIKLKSSIKEISKQNNKFILSDTSDNKYEYDAVVITTGGQAYRQTGSTGDGYYFAHTLGHTITELGPSLTSFIAMEEYVKSLAGISLENARLSSAIKSGGIAAFTGPMLFTHKGITGPAVFALSALLAFETIDSTGKVINIDIVPEVNEEALQAQIMTRVNESPKKQVWSAFHGLAPKALIEKILVLNDIDPTKPANEVPHNFLKKAVQGFKKFQITAIGRGKGDEFVTAGGVDTAEVNHLTMESKLVPNLFFAGEILNIDGFTGGFNLQASWATGRLAGKSINKNAN